MVVRVSAAAGVAILVASTVARVEDLIERTAAEELSENFLWIAEHEREAAAEDEIALERIVLVSSTVVVAVICVVVS